MYSNEDLERFYFKYQTEALPHGQSLQSFCLNNNVLYNIFQNGTKIVQTESRTSSSLECYAEVQPIFCKDRNNIDKKQAITQKSFIANERFYR